MFREITHVIQVEDHNLDHPLENNDCNKHTTKWSRCLTHREQAGYFEISHESTYILVICPHFDEFKFPFLLRTFDNSPNYQHK